MEQAKSIIKILNGFFIKNKKLKNNRHSASSAE